MNPVPAAVKATALPQVNLLPPEVEKRRAVARQRAASFAILGVFVVGLGGVWFWLQTAANEALDAQLEAEAERTRIQTEIAKYSEVGIVEAQLANAENARLYAAGTEVSMAEFWPELVNSFPDDVTIEALGQNLMTLGASASLEGTLFGSPDIGVITFTVIAPSYQSAPAIEDSLNESDFLDFARVNSIEVITAVDNPEGATEGAPTTGTYRMAGVARVNFSAFTQRFSPAWFGGEGVTGNEDYYLGLWEDLKAPPAPSIEPTVEPTPSPEADDQEGGA